jgi:Uma2 family endonuclease
MADAAARHATYEDLLGVPDTMIAEIVCGTLVTQPRPGSSHAWVASAIGDELGGPFRRGRGGPGGWVILFEPELHLGADILVPDFAGWTRERMPVMPDVAYFTLAPDWALEILSTNSAAHDRVDKAAIYAREGVSYLWFIDPAAQTLEANVLENEHWVRIGAWRGNDKARVPPFDAIEVELQELWAR